MTCGIRMFRTSSLDALHEEASCCFAYEGLSCDISQMVLVTVHLLHVLLWVPSLCLIFC